jgi:hypothetical protein
MTKKNSIKVALKDGAPEESVTDMKVVEERVEKAAKKEDAVKPCIVASTVDYPVDLEYGLDKIRLTGRQRIKLADFDKLKKPLPKGVSAKEL